DDSPFFTSDFPVAIEETDNPQILNRIVPLSPNIAVRIIPNPMLDRSEIDLSFKNFRYRSRQAARQEVRNLNSLIVRCAEDLILYRHNYPWIQPFVVKNRRHRIQAKTVKIKTGDGILVISTHRIVEDRAL